MKASDIRHTKGTWNQCCADTTPHFVFADEDKAICAIRCNDPANTDYNNMEGIITNEERIANAKLIAAAPDLLDYLLAAYTFLRDNKKHLPKDRQEVVSLFMDGVETVLTKATK